MSLIEFENYVIMWTGLTMIKERSSSLAPGSRMYLVKLLITYNTWKEKLIV